jgi:hypothetical protein
MMIGLVATVVLVGGYFMTALLLGAEIGQPCDKEWGCKGLDAYCLEGDDASICSQSCSGASDCPDGYACAPITVWTLDGQSPNPEVSADQACIPAEAATVD